MVLQNRPGVYLITNTATGAVYVGSSVYSVAQRWSHHQCDLRKGRHGNPHLQNAWNKYGASAFTCIALEYVSDRSRVIGTEQKWLDYYLNEWGGGECYNVRPKAESCLGIKHNVATRARHAMRMWGNTFSKRTAHIIATKLSKTYPGLVAPDGTEYRDITNLNAFAREHGLSCKAIYAIANGKRLSWKGWTRIDADRSKMITRVFHFTSPDGVVCRDITNLVQFSKEHGLCSTAMGQVYAGKQPHHKSWYKADAEPPGRFHFTAPDGTEYKNIVKLASFCREHGLDKAAMSRVYTGALPHYKRWVKS